METTKTRLVEWCQSDAYLNTEEGSDERIYIEEQPGMDCDFVRVWGYDEKTHLVALSRFDSEILFWDYDNVLDTGVLSRGGIIKELIENFYDERKGWTEVAPEDINDHQLVLKFRGGVGYSYSFWIPAFQTVDLWK